MNSEKLLIQLAERARREEAPRVDVTGNVMAAIEAGQAPAAGDNQLAFATLAWTAGIVVAITLVVTLLTIPLWRTTTGPLTELLIALQI